jgi:glucuronokinase
MPSAEEAQGIALARAALAGNPSDGYGGAVLATTLDGYRAEVRARPGPALATSPASELVEAAVRRFAREIEPAAASTAIEWQTSIPRGVGLGGSSAIVIASLRALSDLYGVRLEPGALAALALAVEREDLGIEAGLQDRVAQAYGGLTFMDFAGTSDPLYEQLDPALLPPLVVAWLVDAAEESGGVHSSLRTRFERGEAEVAARMGELASHARAARAALIGRDYDRFAACVDGSFDARARILALDPRHVSMIDCARSVGASANYTGSGGAIVAVCRDAEHRGVVHDSLLRAGCGVVQYPYP